MKKLRIEIDEEDLRRRLEAAAPGAPSAGRVWKDWEDKLLLEYWPKRSKAEAAAAFGCNETTARARYRKLTQGGNA